MARWDYLIEENENPLGSVYEGISMGYEKAGNKKRANAAGESKK